MTNQQKHVIIVSDDTVYGGFMKISAIHKILNNTQLFSMLNDKETDLLICSSKVKSFETGQEIASENEIAIILKGSITVTKQMGEKSLLMRILGIGSVSGVASLFCDEHRALTTLTAQKVTEVLAIPCETIEALIEKNPEFAIGYIRFLTSRIRFLNGRIKAYTVGGVQAKLALHLLLSDENNTGQIILPVSISTLADMLDMGRASLYRALDSLTENGIISRNGKTITILNTDALKSISEGAN